MKRYAHNMLSEDQIRWIINTKHEGKLTNRKIARHINQKGAAALQRVQKYRGYLCSEKSWKT